MNKYAIEDKTIGIFGNKGMVGSAVERKLIKENCNIITCSRNDLDLCNQSQVEDFFSSKKLDGVIVCAAKVGGILANDTYPANFLYENIMIQTNIVHAAYRNNVEKLIMLGSSCIYPKLANQPIKESELLTGSLEKTNEWYALAKIAGIKLCQSYRKQHDCDFISAMPCNLYGPLDNFDLKNSHVIPALIRKFHQAKIESKEYVEVWGSGKPFREFLHVDDCAEGIVYLFKNYSDFEHVNIGTGKDISIHDLASLIKKISNYNGEIKFNSSKPDGTYRKKLDTSKINSLGWYPQIYLEEGLERTYSWYLDNIENVKIK
jgi:GDP-L-fucose synthase